MDIGLAGVIGSGVSAAANIGAQAISAKIQKDLLKNQYDQYFNAARRAGATPAAIAEGLTSSGASGTPSVSSGAPMPDLGNTAISAYDVQSQAARREKENQETDMRLLFEPKRYRIDFMKSFSEVMKNNQSVRTDKALADWYKEQTNNMHLLRPWQISTLQMGLVKMVAEYENILQNTKESKSRENLNYSEIGLNEHKANLIDAQAGLAWSEARNKDLEAFRIQFDNMCLAAGYDIQTSAGENLKRWMLTSPKRFISGCNALIQTCNIVDGKLQEQLGKNYKRNLKIGAAIYFGSKLKDRSFNHLEQMSRIIGNVVPLANPAPSSPSPSLLGNGYSISF